MSDNSRTLVWFVVSDNETLQTEAIHIISKVRLTDQAKLDQFISKFCSEKNLILNKSYPIIHDNWPSRVDRIALRLPLGEFKCLACNQSCLLRGIWFESSSLPDNHQFCSDHYRRKTDKK